MDEPRKGFVFYRSFYEGLCELNDYEHFRMYHAMCKYALYGEDTYFEDAPLRMAFNLIKVQIDTNNQRYENGKKGGAPRGNKNAQKKGNNQNQPKTTEINQKQPEEEKEVEAEAEKEVDVEKTDIVQTPDGRKAGRTKNGVTDKEAEEVFATLWALYPSKKGKGRISNAKKKELAKIGAEELARAIERYTTDLAKDSWRKPQNGSTFFNSGYIDYLDRNYEDGEANGKTKWDIGVEAI